MQEKTLSSFAPRNINLFTKFSLKTISKEIENNYFFEKTLGLKSILKCLEDVVSSWFVELCMVYNICAGVNR